MRSQNTLLHYVSLILSVLLITNTVAGEAISAPPPRLRIVIVEGEGATNNIRQRTAREPVVRVEDENNKPVSGALVVFLLPDKGPSGTFADGSTRLTVLTDPSGRAAARGLEPNNMQGSFRISVQVSHLGDTATASIIQSNVAGAAAAAGISAKLLTFLAIGGGAAAATAVALSRGGRNTGPAASNPTDTLISAGRPAVGGPQQ